MRLLDALAVNRAHAEAAVKYRDAGAEKSAADKQADLAAMMAYMKGGLKNVGAKLTGFFRPSADELAMRAVKSETAKRFQVLQAASPLNAALSPSAPVQMLQDYVSKATGPGGRTQVNTELDALRSMAQVFDSKKPSTSMKTMAIMGLAGGTAASVLGNLAQKHKHEANLRLVMDDPNIPASHKIKAQNAFQILANYAPSIANDPIFSKDFVRNLVRFDMIDHKIVSDLILAEKNYLESKGKRSTFMGSMRDTAMGVLLGSGG